MPEKLSEHFTFEELTHTDQEDLAEDNKKEAKAYKNTLKKVCLELLEPIRKQFGPVIINSGFRGKTLNDRVGGSKTSQHFSGQAADFNVKGKEDRAGQIEVVKWIRDNIKAFGQCLLEKNCIHISIGTKKEIKEYSVKDKSKIDIPELSA